MTRCQNIISDIEDADIERMVIDKLLRPEMKTGVSGLYNLYIKHLPFVQPEICSITLNRSKNP